MIARARLEAWLYQEIPPHIYAWLRIGCGLCIALTLMMPRDRLVMLYSDAGVLPTSSPAFVPLPGPNLLAWATSPDAVVACQWATIGLAILYALGAGTVLTGPLLWVGLVSFIHRNVYAAYGAHALLAELLFLLLWTPAGRTFSLDARWRRLAPTPTLPIVVHLIRFQICVMYLKSGFYKLMGVAWLHGDALLIALRNPNCRHFDLDWLLAWPTVIAAARVMTWTVLAWELLFPLLILWRPTRRLAIGIGIVNHLFIFLTIEVGTFAPAVLVAYLAFADPVRVAGSLKRDQAPRPSEPPSLGATQHSATPP